MRCIDRTDKNGKPVNLKLFGPNDNTPHRRMELLFLPADCNATKENCSEKLKRIKEHVGIPNLFMIYN